MKVKFFFIAIEQSCIVNILTSAFGLSLGLILWRLILSLISPTLPNAFFLKHQASQWVLKIDHPPTLFSQLKMSQGITP